LQLVPFTGYVFVVVCCSPVLVSLPAMSLLLCITSFSSLLVLPSLQLALMSQAGLWTWDVTMTGQQACNWPALVTAVMIQLVSMCTTGQQQQ